MTRSTSVVGSAIGVAVTALMMALTFVACDDTGIVLPACGVIPEDGCPVGRGKPCLDRTCAASYRCESDDTWHLVETCPNFDPSAKRDAASTDGDADDAATTVDAPFVDAPPGAFGGPGCPFLESPDCALGTVLACSRGCCGCEDLFVCRAGAWDYAGSCDPDSGINSP